MLLGKDAALVGHLAALGIDVDVEPLMGRVREVRRESLTAGGVASLSASRHSPTYDG